MIKISSPLDSNNFEFICAGLSIRSSYIRCLFWCNLSCLCAYCNVSNNGSCWRKDAYCWSLVSTHWITVVGGRVPTLEFGQHTLSNCCWRKGAYTWSLVSTHWVTVVGGRAYTWSLVSTHWVTVVGGRVPLEFGQHTLNNCCWRKGAYTWSLASTHWVTVVGGRVPTLGVWPAVVGHTE